MNTQAIIDDIKEMFADLSKEDQTSLMKSLEGIQAEIKNPCEVRGNDVCVKGSIGTPNENACIFCDKEIEEVAK